MSLKTWSTEVKPEKKLLIPCAVCGSLKFKASLSCGNFNYVRCGGCGLVQMNPQPLEEEIRRRYTPGGDYLVYEIANEESYLNLQLLALKDAGFGEIETEIFEGRNSCGSQLSEKPRILDIGCAIGSLLSSLRERGWETTGVEISGLQAEYGRRKKNLDIRSLPLKENNFPASSFNAVLASHLIEHLNDPASLVREVNRILIPGGRFFVTTPNISGFQAGLFGSRWRSAIFDHLYLFSVKTLSRLLKEAGFIIEKTATWGGLAAGSAPAPVKRLFDRAAKSFGFGDVMIVRSMKKSEI